MSFEDAKHVVQSHVLTLSYFESEQIFMKSQHFSHKTILDPDDVETLRVSSFGEAEVDLINNATFIYVSHNSSSKWLSNVLGQL